MAFNCGVSFGACLVRITRVDSNGNVIAGSNSYTTDKPISIGVNANNEAGNSFSVRNGCGCGIARRKFPDTFNYWELSLQMASLEPQMIAFMLGASTIEDGADVVGVAFPSALACDEQSPLVAFEFWSEHIVGSGLDATYPYFHWVFPATSWVISDNTFEEGPAQPSLTGTSQTNGNWGDGPYGDGPPDSQDISEGGFWATADALPTAECASQSVTSVS
jgi:hypothetical protein